VDSGETTETLLGWGPESPQGKGRFLIFAFELMYLITTTSVDNYAVERGLVVGFVRLLFRSDKNGKYSSICRYHETKPTLLYLSNLKN